MFDMIGEFDVVSGQVRISDPCYDLEVAASLCGTVPAVNGRWAASVERSDEGGWGTRIARLLVTHVDCPVPAGCDWRLLSFRVGVDSGQAGVFDASHYLDDSVAPEVPEAERFIPEEPWYSMCCEVTLSDAQAGVVPFGAVASSGFGDGLYRVFGLFDGDDLLLGVLIAFIDEEADEDEWDEEEWDEGEEEEDEDWDEEA